MRSYPPNSPEATTRVVMAMLADGQLTRAELEAFALARRAPCARA